MTAIARQWSGLRQIVAMVVLAVALAGCSHVHLVAPYDAATDTELGALLQDSTTFVARMVSRAGTPAGSHAENSDFHDQAEERVALLVAGRGEPGARRLPFNTDDGPGAGPRQFARRLARTNRHAPARRLRCGANAIAAAAVPRSARLSQGTGALGIPAVATGPLLEGGLGATLRAAMAVQRAKNPN